jgi:hypothetical protein
MGAGKDGRGGNHASIPGGVIRALVEEGALSKATKLLVSTGLANSQDPSVERTLREMAYLQPRQCGFRVRNAAEMVGMGLQRLVQSRHAQGENDYVVLQVDMRNAFNSISRDAVLRGCMAAGPDGVQLVTLLLRRCERVVLPRALSVRESCRGQPRRCMRTTRLRVRARRRSRLMRRTGTLMGVLVPRRWLDRGEGG